MEKLVYLFSTSAFNKDEIENKTESEIYDLWLHSNDQTVKAYTLQGFQDNYNLGKISESEWWIRIVS